MGADWAIEALKDNFTQLLKCHSFAQAQLGNHVRDKNLFWQRVRAEPGRHLDGGSEEVGMVLDRFPGRGANPDFDRALVVGFSILAQLAVNPTGAFNRCRRRNK